MIDSHTHLFLCEGSEAELVSAAAAAGVERMLTVGLDEATNAEAFRRRRIVPRMLRDVAERDLSTELLGTAMPAPLMLAPIGVQKILHEDGELAELGSRPGGQAVERTPVLFPKIDS